MENHYLITIRGNNNSILGQLDTHDIIPSIAIKETIEFFHNEIDKYLSLYKFNTIIIEAKII